MTDVAIAFVIALVVGLVFQPALLRLCQRIGQVDHPDGKRKQQPRPIPLSGGPGTAIAILAGISAAITISNSLAVNPEVLVFAGGAFLALLMGIVDDRHALNAWQKLLVQILAAGCACYAGFTIGEISVPFVDRSLDLGHAAYPVTVLWFAACMNGYNFIDGSDGVAVGTGIGIGAGIVAIAIMTHNYFVAAIAAALVGGLVTFAPWNRPPARAYLGDAGAMFVGYLLAALALAAPLSGDSLPFSVCLLLMAYPLYDVVTTPVRRCRQGLPLGRAERGHPHFALLSRGNSPTRVAATITFGNVTIAGLAIIATRSSDEEAFGILLLVAAALAWITLRLGIVAK